MNYIEARELVKEGKEASRKAWNGETKIRLAVISDNDYINYPNLDGVIVSECPNRKCDCIICIYNPSAEDQAAEDWEILN